MRDMQYIGEDGSRTPVSAMPVADIERFLRDGFQPVYEPGDSTSEPYDYWVRLRLEVELIIRAQGLQ